ncbi:hypothetical protein QCI42_22560 [Bacillus fungorum]|uniref:hypothetical protein n=1 Tax=Bacillus fungorum TaxID=2039284 RepID=UPI0033913415
MKTFFEFLDDLGINKKLKRDLEILILSNSDLKHFEDKIFSPDKSFDVMVYEMRKHKLLERPISLTQFELFLSEDESLAVSRLMAQHISLQELSEIKGIMQMKKVTYSDIYHKHMEQLESKSICNIWQLIL